MSLSSMMNILVTTERPVESKDTYGGSSESFSDNLTNQRFKLDELSAAEVIQNSRESHIVNAKGYAPLGVDILEKDRIKYDSRTFRVVGVRQIRGPLGTAHHTAIDLEELT